MKRILFFVLILIILFVVTFGISLLFSPEWTKQIEWPQKLFNLIIIGGLIIIAEGLVSWSLSFVFEDNELKERLNFLLGKKYKEISNKLDEFTRFEINKEKRSRKYIPNIFVELTEVKEKLRYFSEPFIFSTKVFRQTEQRLRGSYIISILNQIHYPIEAYKALHIRGKVKSRKSLIRNIAAFNKFLNQKSEITNVIIKNDGVGLKPELRSRIPSKFSHWYDYAYPNLQHYLSFENEIKQAKEDSVLFTNKLVIIKSIAGHGKTNLLCDFTENFLLKKKHKCIYLSARELNYLGEQETIEQLIARIIFTESHYQFSDILRLIKFDKRIDYLYILIDGINEHKNLLFFPIALEQFIQRCNEYDIKIILTCRSEYFDDRFGNLLHIENISILDMDAWYYINKIPDVHQKALISRYFSEFNIQLHSNRVHPEIIDIFNRDKLLLRVFCEAYENNQPADYLDDLYKLEIFQKYYEKKLETIPGLDSCLLEIITWMIEHEEFTDIRISNLSKETTEVVEATAYENIIIRKDVITTPGIAFSRYDVINFVYDEFRDFLIASRVILNWGNENPSSREQIYKFTRARSSISEGLQKYLCLWGIRNDQRELLEFLSSMSWFDMVFIDAAFDTPDKFITVFTVDMIQKLFGSKPVCALQIIFYLSHRVKIDRYPNLNIEHLFTLLNNMNELEYQNIISDALNMDYDYKTSCISYLCHSIVEAFQEDRISEGPGQKLIKLLSYLVGIRDIKFPTYRDYGFGPYPARDAILIISKNMMKQTIIDQVHQVSRIIRNESVINNLREITRQLGEG